MEKKVLEARERYNKICELIGDNRLANELLDKLVKSAARYVDVVAVTERRIQSARFRLEGEEFRQFVMELDRQRKLAHDALISSLYSFNRYILKEYGDECPVGGIYSLDPTTIRDRWAVGSWAGFLVDAIFGDRRR